MRTRNIKRGHIERFDSNSVQSVYVDLRHAHGGADVVSQSDHAPSGLGCGLERRIDRVVVEEHVPHATSEVQRAVVIRRARVLHP